MILLSFYFYSLLFSLWNNRTNTINRYAMNLTIFRYKESVICSHFEIHFVLSRFNRSFCRLIALEMIFPWTLLNRFAIWPNSLNGNVYLMIDLPSSKIISEDFVFKTIYYKRETNIIFVEGKKFRDKVRFYLPCHEKV